MYLIDFHLHSKFSPDSDFSPKRIAEAAIKEGIKEICFTDHIDFGGAVDDEFRLYNYDAAKEEIDACQEEFKERIKIHRGIEVGYVPAEEENIKDWLDDHKFDYVIGSIHRIGEELMSDLRDESFFPGKNLEEIIKPHLEVTRKLVGMKGYFNSIGHFDLMKKIGTKFLGPMDYMDFKDEVIKILKMAISNKIGLEVNTSGYGGRPKESYPSENILQKYFDLGGRIVTLGSDGHCFSTNEQFRSCYFDNLTKGYDMIKRVGFKEIDTFENRKVMAHKI